ncbi:MAG: DUF11 domain-containing protein [Gammaproteobacteria bacterium]|nr:DUF11 domain-containing protein [Gammaproteobacteria bacterium]
MKRLSVLIALLLLAASPSVFAVGTAAGTDIDNQATVDFDIGASSFSQNSSVVTVTVEELINVTVTSQDAGNVVVLTPATDESLLFRVTNTGNGPETFDLSFDLSPGAPVDDFDPTTGRIYYDDGTTPGVFDASDTLYVLNTNDPTLAADASQDFLLVANIPGSLTDGDLGHVDFTATSETGTGVAGTVITDGHAPGVDSIIGTSTGTDTDQGTFEVNNITIAIVKSAPTISDPFGGTEPVPGSTITYRIVITPTGSGTATNVIVTDVMPANTTYVAASMTLNAGALTDAADADAGDYNGVTETVTVDLGSLTGTDGAQTIEFQVTID